MIPYRAEKIANAVCYFAREHHKKTRRHSSQTQLYKYLAFFEYRYLEETGIMPLGLSYQAQDHGPVPKELYYKRREIESECFEFVELANNKFIVKAKCTPTLDYFSDREIELMKELIEIFANRKFDSSFFSEVSHEIIRAWRVAYKRGRNSDIDNSDTFEDIFLKSEDDLSPQEEHFLIAKALERAGT